MELLSGGIVDGGLILAEQFPVRGVVGVLPDHLLQAQLVIQVPHIPAAVQGDTLP